tara:strand:+ start:999 stop:2474 length:1476 start_codon:yes stop_codon:yes gene_type:complete
MNDILYKKGYVVLDNFFSDIQTDYYMSKVVDILYEKDMMLGNQMSDSVHPMTWNVNSHPVWESLMWNSLSEVERCTDEKLFPTYSFQRVYLKDAHMSHHSDWPWCQISITVNLGQSHPYPLFVTDLETNESVEIIQKPGQALLYLGHNISHYRNKFEGDWYSQLFLHYVYDNQKNEEYHRFNSPVFNFTLEDKMEEIFYPKEVQKLKYDEKDYPMNEEDKDIIKPMDPSLFKTTHSKPRISLEDMHQPVLEKDAAEYNFPILDKFMDSIYQTHQALSPEFCKQLIDIYEDCASKGEARHGMTHSGLDNDIKNTGEIDLMRLEGMEKYCDILREASDTAIQKYVSKFGMLQHYEPHELYTGGVYYPMWEIHKYDKGFGHYEAWHTEGSQYFEFGNRMFVSMFYLNDVEYGGRTVFPYSRGSIKCETGKHLTFPCMWPYVHYAQTPESDDKYIVTTWLQKKWPAVWEREFETLPTHDKRDDYRKTQFIFEENE